MENKTLVLLAAGEATRLGQPKHLYPVRGRPWIEHQIEAAGELGFTTILLVLGPRHEETFRKPTLPTLQILRNPQPEYGPFSSLQCALGVVQGDFWLCPVDTPLPESEVLEKLDSMRGQATLAQVPTVEGRGGHPVWISGRWIQKLKAFWPDDRLDKQLHLLGPNEIQRVAVESAEVLANLNSPEAFSKRFG